ncbi:hypothetical protein EGR_06200 [Echinococcus granulosus]|uniref:Uncharacterized protein n=1 Tax=Echinococcus granulosus TaxID=6210 RepID=W6UDT5_ECHGR|nr:hypothetical protein EGR_06200 [Echinococcus granulosus]EUB58981.1 hypothetical protein EGR_06200 [Echinococcus granulosus]
MYCIVVYNVLCDARACTSFDVCTLLHITFRWFRKLLRSIELLFLLTVVYVYNCLCFVHELKLHQRMLLRQKGKEDKKIGKYICNYTGRVLSLPLNLLRLFIDKYLLLPPFGQNVYSKCCSQAPGERVMYCCKDRHTSTLMESLILHFNKDTRNPKCPRLKVE